MIRRLKMFLFQRFYVLKVVWCRLRGLEVETGCIISGHLDFRLCKGDRIRLDNTTIVSPLPERLGAGA